MWLIVQPSNEKYKEGDWSFSKNAQVSSNLLKGNLRLRVFVETGLFWIVVPAMSCFPFVNSIFTAPISLYYTNNYEDKEEEGNGQHHADKPSGCCHIFFGLNDWPFCNTKKISLRTMHTKNNFKWKIICDTKLTNAEGFNIFRMTFSVEFTINCNYFDFINFSWAQTTQNDEVFICFSRRLFINCLSSTPMKIR